MQTDPQKLKVAVCQIFCLDGDREGNFARIEHALQEAKAGNASVACFPEMAILGWVNQDAHTRGYAIPGPDSERIAVLAQKYDMFICIGMAEKVGAALYDAVILVEISLHHK